MSNKEFRISKEGFDLRLKIVDLRFKKWTPYRKIKSALKSNLPAGWQGFTNPLKRNKKPE
jgi:hypothetical protein